MVLIRRFVRLGCSATLSVTAVLSLASSASAATATLTLNPNHEVASAAGNYLDATLYVDTCFTGLTAKIFWGQLITPVAQIVHPPCSGQTMTVFFSHVSGPGPSPGYTTFTAGLWDDSDVRNLRAYVAAQAVFRMDPSPLPPCSNPVPPPPPCDPGPQPPSQPGPPGPPAAPPSAVVPSPSPPSATPTATPCPVLTAAINRGSSSPATPGPQAGLVLLLSVLLVTAALARAIRRRRAAALLLLILVTTATLSCGRHVPIAASDAPSPTASQLAPSPSPTCSNMAAY